MFETLDDDYRPSDDEPFMNDKQLSYFREKLVTWRDQLLRESDNTIKSLTEETHPEADVVDLASNEFDRTLILRARDRQRRLMNKIEAALQRIDEGEYGYCKETGEPINLRRLEARPTAILSIEAQERHERHERMRREEW